MRTNKRNGFTLLEIIVVIAILAILLSIVIVSGTDARSTADATVADQDVQQIGLALQLYLEANGELPSSISALHPDYLSKEMVEDAWGNAFAYQNNYDGGTTGYGSWVCSLGPNETLDTDAADLGAYEVTGDDICRFVFDED